MGVPAEYHAGSGTARNNKSAAIHCRVWQTEIVQGQIKTTVLPCNESGGVKTAESGFAGDWGVL